MTTLRDSNKITFEGDICDLCHQPLKGIFVTLNEKMPEGTKVLQALTTDNNGLYFFEVDISENCAYFISAKGKNEEILATSDYVFKPLKANRLDITITQAQYQGPSLLERCAQVFQAYPEEAWSSPGAIETFGTQIPYIAGKLEVGKETVLLYMKSYVLAAKSKLPQSLFFAWGIYGLPLDLAALGDIQSSYRNKLIMRAISNHVITVSGDQEELSDASDRYFVEQMLEQKTDRIPLRDNISLVISDPGIQQQIFINYINSDNGSEEFWQKLETTTGNSNDADLLQLALKLVALTGNKFEITKALFNALTEKQLPNPIKTLARWPRAKLEKLITPHFKKESSEDCASRIIDLLRKSYPTDVLFASLSSAKTNKKTQALPVKYLADFLERYPDFAFESSMPATPADLDYLPEGRREQLLQALHSIKRLFIHTQHFDALDQLLTNGIDSSYAITRFTRADFTKEYQTTFGSVTAAEDVYDMAQKAHLQSLSIWSKYNATLNATTGVTPLATTLTDVTLRDLFGSLDWTNYPYCTSVLSPSAYFADTLNFISANAPYLYTELQRRRPDLLAIYLNCDNSETLMPYTDLVNELLERFVLAHKTPPVIPPPYQTSWTETELSVAPENLNYSAYDDLKSAVFPMSLPFNFPLSETRIYLSQLRLPRHHLMSLFFPSALKQDPFNDYNIGLEKLGLSPEQGNIITGSTLGDGSASSGIWNFYGFDKPSGFKPIIDPANSLVPIATGVWTDVLTGRVDIFLQQTGLAYNEMLSLLLTDFINPTNAGVQRIQIVAKTTDPAGNPVQSDTSDLSLLELHGTTLADFAIIYRFVRLAKSIQISFYDLDKILHALKPALVTLSDWQIFITVVSQTIQLQQQLGLRLDEILAFWADLGTRSYTDYSTDEYPVITSLFDRLFQNRSLTSSPSNVQAMPASTVSAALQISVKQLNLLVSTLGVPTTWTVAGLSLLYRHVRMAQVLNLSIEDFLKAKTLTGSEPFVTPTRTFLFLSVFKALNNSFFNFQQVNYLLAHDVSHALDIIPKDDLISSFLSELRTAVRAGFSNGPTQQGNTDTFIKIIAQKFSEKLKISYISAVALLTDHSTSGQTPFVNSFLPVDLPAPQIPFLADYSSPQGDYQPVFVRGNTNNNNMAVDVTSLFNIFVVLNKISTIINALNIDDTDLPNLLTNWQAIGCLSLVSLPVSPIANPNAPGYITLEHLMQAKALLPTGTPLLFDIIACTSKPQWITSLCTRTSWDTALVKLLIGDENTLPSAGWLQTNYPADFRNGDLILRLVTCINTIGTMGNNTDLIKGILNQSVTADISQAVKDMIKSNFNDTDWIKVIKPLRDELRETQRSSLVAYIINKPDPALFQRWTNSDGLYEYMLIDVEMRPVSQTSRIKQALCSVQLIVDRAIIGQEFQKGNPLLPIRVTADFVNEWKQWRSLYRVWEASRKIFLYPENWLEPELRDDKSSPFTDLETELRQNELNDENLQTSFLNYLEKIEEVSRLTVVGTYSQNDQQGFNPDTQSATPPVKVLHVFGRTLTSPYSYYYRTFDEISWSTWEKVDLSIDSGQVFTLMSGKRICLFWLLFTEQHEQQDSLSAAAPVNTPPGYWKIQVVWSFYQNGKWSAKHISNNWFESNRFYNLAGTSTIKAQMELFKNGLILYYQDADDGFSLRTPVDSSKYYLAGGIPTFNGVMLSFRDVFHDPVITETTANILQNTILLSQTTPKDMLLVGNPVPVTSNHYILYKSTDIVLNSIGNNFALTVPWQLSSATYSWSPQESDFFYQDASNTFWIRNTSTSSASFFKNEYFSFSDWKQAVGSSRLSYESSQLAAPHAPIPADSVYSLTFKTFYQPNIKIFIQTLNVYGLMTLLSRSMQAITPDSINFLSTYTPGAVVNATQGNVPDSSIDFSMSGTYSKYNWEIFFHLPLLIANRLSTDQQFDTARNWYHCIFNPTRQDPGGAERFWRFQPFYDQSLKKINTLNDLLSDQTELNTELNAWMVDPFQPHIIARIRVIAYMKNVVMKYLDNLIAWADTLFQADDIEDINQATNLYLLADKILGPKPQPIPPRVGHLDKSFNDIQSTLDPFSNTLVKIETYFPPSAGPAQGTTSQVGQMFYFSIPSNATLLAYWNTIADRLFKIRNGQNIQGTIRQLSLYGSAIDPGLLVKANAMGMDLNSILASIQAALPYYRFKYMVQILKELITELKEFGQAFLTALEKRDDAAFQLLSSAHGQQLLQGALQVKQSQVTQDSALLDSATNAVELAQINYNYYSSRQFTNVYEQQYLNSIQQGLVISIAQGGINTAAATMAAIPNFKVGAPTSVGATYGGENLSAILTAISNYMGIMASINSAQGNMASALGGFTRRMDDWTLQGNVAAKQTQQMERQQLAAQIRLEMSNAELSNLQLQIQNAASEDQFMRSRFTSQDLYDWEIDQLSTIYFQSYQLTYDFAKKVEKCFQFETGQFKKSYVQFGYWDSLKKGLLSAEKLQYDLRRMETAFLEQDKPQFELTKYLSLAFFTPKSLVELIQNGTTDFVIPEEIFDLDYPGHYYRRLKSIAVTIPCVTGPYTTINCTLTLNTSYIRIDNSITTGYPCTTKYNDANEKRFYQVTERNGALIATSGSQNDDGLFTTNFADDHYLPFEGAGVFGTFTLSLNTAPELRQFDYSTITDVVLQLTYTAKDGGSALKTGAENYLKTLITNTTTADPSKSGMELWRMFGLRHEFSNEWYRFFHPATGSPTALSITVTPDRFPYIAQHRKIMVKNVTLKCLNASVDPTTLFTVTLNGAAVVQGALGVGNFMLTLNAGNSIDENNIQDLFLIIDYTLQ